jgi:hypothetical protein
MYRSYSEALDKAHNLRRKENNQPCVVDDEIENTHSFLLLQSN